MAHLPAAKLGIMPFGQWPGGPGHLLECGTWFLWRVVKGTGPKSGVTAGTRSDHTHCPQLLPQPGEGEAGFGTEGEPFTAGAPSLEIPKRRFSAGLKEHLGLALRFLCHCEQVFHVL